MNEKRIVILYLQGDLVEKGFTVISLIKDELRNEELVQEKGVLPPAPHLIDLFNSWISKMHNYARLTEGNHDRFVSKTSSIDDLLNQKEQNVYNLREVENNLITSFNNWLNLSDGLIEIRRELDNKVSESATVRLMIRTNNSQIIKLPWQRWDWLTYQRRKGSLFFGSISQRYLKLTQQNKLRVQIVLGDTKTVQRELDILHKVFSQHEVLPELINRTTTDIYNCLQNTKYDIFYFSGHGKTIQDIGRIYINQTEYLEIEQLNFKASVENGLKLAIFNSCQGLGLALELDRHRILIPNLIVMKDIIPEQVAPQFLEDCLKLFLDENYSLDLAVSEACNKLKAFEPRYPGLSLMPLLFQVSEKPQYYSAWLVKEEPIIAKPISNRLEKIIPAKNLNFRMILMLSLIITGFITWLRWEGKLERLELQAFDILMRQRSLVEPQVEQQSADPRLLVIGVTKEDEEGLKELIKDKKKLKEIVKEDGKKLDELIKDAEQEQGPRTLSNLALQIVLEKLNKYKPKVIGLDLFLPSKIDEKYSKLKSMLLSKNLIHACVIKDKDSPDVSGFSQAPPENKGFVNIQPDLDDVIRRYILVMSNNNNNLDSPCGNLPGNTQAEAFTLKIALNYLGIQRSDKQSDDFVRVGSVTFKQLKNHYAAYNNNDDAFNSNEIILNCYPCQDKTDIANSHSAMYVIKDQLKEAEVKDKIILIGADSSQDDIHETSYSHKLPGVFINAQIVRFLIDVIDGKQKTIIAFSWFIDAFWIWIWSIIGGTIIWLIPYTRGKEERYFLNVAIISGLALSSLYVFCFICLINLGAWLPLVPPFLSMSATELIVVHRFLRNTHR